MRSTAVVVLMLINLVWIVKGQGTLIYTHYNQYCSGVGAVAAVAA